MCNTKLDTDANGFSWESLVVDGVVDVGDDDSGICDGIDDESGIRDGNADKALPRSRGRIDAVTNNSLPDDEVGIDEVGMNEVGSDDDASSTSPETRQL